jgi:hypothetical protein
MRVRLNLLAAAIARLVMSAPALAQEARPQCAPMDANLPPELAAWGQKRDIVSATRAADLATAALTPGQAVNATLHPTRQVAYVAQPEKPGGSVAHGGLLRVRIASAGTYRFVLGSGAWIDVLKNGTRLVSSAHAPGPSCSTARKMVEFPLEAGDYVLQVSANADPELSILIVPRP